MTDMAQTTKATARGGARARGGATARGSAKPTIDHDEIRRWVEERGGKPAVVKRTANGRQPGILRIDFPGFSGEQSLAPLEWDEWFERFDSANLAFLHQDETGSGRPSRFNKLVARESVENGDGKRSTRRSGAQNGRRARAGARKAPAKKASARTGASSRASGGTQSSRNQRGTKRSSSRSAESRGSSRTQRAGKRGSTGKRASSGSKGRKSTFRAASRRRAECWIKPLAGKIR
jgi:hypothetical protein